METIYIGTPYRSGFKHEDGTAFADAPKVVLYNKSSKSYCEVLATSRQSDNGYNFEFSAAVTKALLPGAYSLEIYNNAKTEMLYADCEFATAVECSMSPESKEIEVESESESE